MTIANHAVEIDLNDLLERFHQYGYLVLPELVESNLVESVRQRIEGFMIRNGSGKEPANHLRQVIDLLEPEDIHLFESLLLHPLLLDLSEKILGEDIRMAETGARWIRPGTQGLPLHVGVPADRLAGESAQISSNCYVLTFSWILSDMTRENGGRFFMPFSHHSGKAPQEGVDYPDTVYVEAKAGSLVLFNSATWHGFDSVPEDSSESRVELCSGYAVPWLDWEEVGWKRIDEKILSRCSETMRRVNGLK